MKGHIIQDKSANNSTGSDRSLPSYPTQRCPNHHEVINIYCKDHDEVACASCMILSTMHRSCANILSIPENIDDLHEQFNLNDIQQKISTTKKTMEDIKTTKENKIEELNKALNTEIEAVKAFRQELDFLLDNMEQETIKELRKEYSNVEASINEEIDNTESLLSSLNEAASQLKTADGNKAQEFICVKTSQKLSDKGKEIQKSHSLDKNEKVFFKSDQSIKAFLEKIQGLGKVHCYPKHSLYKVKQQRDITVKLDSDETLCYIHGSCVTEDGYLLLSDWSNKKLKRMDLSTEKVVDDIKLQDSPRGVCTVSITEAAVALYNNSVQFVSLGAKMAATRTVTMGHTCFGLAFNDGKLFTYDQSNTMYIYDINGQQQHKFTLDGLSSNLSTYSATYYVVRASGDRVYIAHHNKGLIVFDNQGNYISTKSHDNKSAYQGVCTDGRNILASVTSTYKIVQMGPDLELLGELCNLENNSLLCFDPQKMSLIAVALGSGKIKVIELE